MNCMDCGNYSGWGKRCTDCYRKHRAAEHRQTVTVSAASPYRCGWHNDTPCDWRGRGCSDCAYEGALA